MRSKKNGRKFMQVLSGPVMKELSKVAKQRGITVQELIRAEIIPSWFNLHNGKEGLVSIDKITLLLRQIVLQDRRIERQKTKIERLTDKTSNPSLPMTVTVNP